MMERITLGDKSFVPYIPYERISEAIDQVADRLNADYQDSEDTPVVLCILNGAILFCAELRKRLHFNLELSSVKLTSYCGTQSTGQVKTVGGLTTDLKGRRVIVVEDIVDTGQTIVAIRQLLEEAGVKESRICALLLKPEVFCQKAPLDYVAMEIPNRFIVGFGLDYNELGRNLKDIYVLDDTQ